VKAPHQRASGSGHPNRHRSTPRSRPMGEFSGFQLRRVTERGRGRHRARPIRAVACWKALNHVCPGHHDEDVTTARTLGGDHESGGQNIIRSRHRQGQARGGHLTVRRPEGIDRTHVRSPEVAGGSAPQARPGVSGSRLTATSPTPPAAPLMTRRLPRLTFRHADALERRAPVVGTAAALEGGLRLRRDLVGRASVPANVPLPTPNTSSPGEADLLADDPICPRRPPDLLVSSRRRGGSRTACRS
jgi:hypothetical protein